MSQHNGEESKGLDQKRESHTVGSLSPTQKTKLTRQKIINNVLNLGLLIFIDVIFSISLFTIFKHFVPEIWAVVISGVPPFLVVVISFIGNRRINILGVLILISFIVNAIILQFRSDPKIVLLRKSAATASVDVAFGGFFGNKDLAEDKSIDDPGWGLGLLAITPLRVLIVYKLDSIDQDILYTNVVTYTWPAYNFGEKMKKSLAGDGQMEAGRMEAGQIDDDQT
ncbi:5245_t:CDS:2 [Entrophospora sp. SA101]|nr:5245_t:CDS:2 [Entrophospora sp. SA101]